MKTFDTSLSAEKLEDAQLPRAFWEFQVDTYTGSLRALKDCDAYARKFGEAKKRTVGLFIRGGPESLKTFLATYVLRRAMLLGHSCLYVSMPDLVDKVLQNEITLRDFLREPDCLVLDNVNQPGNNFWVTALNRVLVLRKDNGRPTVVVTQLGVHGRNDLFGAAYGDVNLRLIEHVSQTIWAESDDTQKQQAEQARKAIFAEEIG